MQMPTAHPAFSMPAAFVALRVAGAGFFARRLASVVGALRFTRHGADRQWMERAAVAGLNERMLKDIGASPWLVSEAAARSRDTLQSRQSYSRHPAGSTAAGWPKLMRPRPRKTNSSRSSSNSGSPSTRQ